MKDDLTFVELIIDRVAMATEEVEVVQAASSALRPGQDVVHGVILEWEVGTPLAAAHHTALAPEDSPLS